METHPGSIHRVVVDRMWTVPRSRICDRQHLLGVCKILQRCILVVANPFHPALSSKPTPIYHTQATMENTQLTNSQQPPGLSLSRILDDDSIEHLEDHGSVDASPDGWDEEASEKQLEDGYCVECEGIPISSRKPEAPRLNLPPRTQINPLRCIVNRARTTFARFASQRNIAKDPGNNTRQKR